MRQDEILRAFVMAFVVGYVALILNFVLSDEERPQVARVPAPTLIAKSVVLELPPTEQNPRNSEGDFIRLIHVRNKAVAFSIGSGLPDEARRLLFSFIPLIIIGLVFLLYFRNDDFTSLQRWSICGILGGGLGNLIDRFFRPDGVVDFIDCYFFGIFGMERWPTFNVAVCAVVVCGILFVLSFIIQIKEDSSDKTQAQEAT